MTMKLKSVITLLLSLTFFYTQAQTDSNLLSKDLFRLGDQNYDLGTFEYYFLKNAEPPSADSAEYKVEEYLDLYVKFRLKVQEAQGLGMDQSPAFIQELEGYKKQLVEPYLIATQYNQNLLEEAYDRLQSEVSAAHILLKVDENALPSDTLAVYNRLLGIKAEIAAGADFATMATRYSEDPSAKMNQGNLGYFSVLQMVYPFENAAYNNPVGTVVGPIKTQFGYHLLEVIDKRPARGQVKVAHIMIRHQQDSASDKAERKIDSIYENLKEGKDWNEQCKMYSEDKSSVNNNGEMRWFGTGALVPEFEDAAFALQNPGDMSEPVETRFGWHIIMLLEKKPVGSFEDMQAELEQRVKRDSRSKATQSVVITTLKKEHAYQLDSVVWREALSAMDSTVKMGQWSYDTTSTTLANALFTLEDQEYTVGDFYAFAEENQRNRQSADLEAYKRQLYQRFETKRILDAEMLFVEQNNVEYQRILDEYRSGILLFNLMEKEVWQKALTDSVGLQDYYESNKDVYVSEEFLQVRKLTAEDKAVLDSASSYLSFSNSQLDSLFNSQEALALQIDDLKIKKGEVDFLDQNWTVGNHRQSTEDYHILWVVSKVIPAAQRPLDSVRGLVISDYQMELEQLWIAQLRKKYPYKLNKKVLKSFVKTFN
ncbi:peptidylprolyl isomerase [Reichenbachiella agariperforans]|nr:peptidylprolyl isomerase [Reichenbachiella agariperforans]